MIQTVEPVVAPERVTPLRPSEALRLGRLTRPLPGLGRLFYDGRACALGAMAIGFFGPGVIDETTAGSWHVHQQLIEHVPALSQDAACPICPRMVDKVNSVVWHLNDYHGWPSEAIAQWLESRGL
jgi:hypothetical protein